MVPWKNGNRIMARLRSSRAAAVNGDEAAWPDIQSAALDGEVGTGTASLDEDGEGLDNSQQQSASEAAESPASVDCRRLSYRMQAPTAQVQQPSFMMLGIPTIAYAISYILISAYEGRGQFSPLLPYLRPAESA